MKTLILLVLCMITVPCFSAPIWSQYPNNNFYVECDSRMTGGGTQTFSMINTVILENPKTNYLPLGEIWSFNYSLNVGVTANNDKYIWFYISENSSKVYADFFYVDHPLPELIGTETEKFNIVFDDISNIYMGSFKDFNSVVNGYDYSSWTTYVGTVNNQAVFFVDDTSFYNVPEPSGLILMGLSVIVLMRRK